MYISNRQNYKFYRLTIVSSKINYYLTIYINEINYNLNYLNFIIKIY